MRLYFTLGFAIFIFVIARAAYASVVINEVLFNPSGSSDTGLEKVELYNSGDTVVSLGGWELYPDKAGYFIFPSGFSIPAHGFLTIHLRSSGASDAENLYQSGTDNMGDSSGSIALFSESGHPADSIVDFVRYQKPGAGESKTWESAASSAGLWTTGTFVDIGGASVGSTIALIKDGVRGNAGSWQISAGTIGSANGSVGPTPPPPPASKEPVDTESALPSVSNGVVVPPRLTAFAGDDRSVFQGGLVEFRGNGEGVDGKPLSNGRFLWNFGDGFTREGKIVLHTFYFPGTYRVSLNVSNGEYSGSDYATVHVFPPKIFISEAKPGDNGFIEIYNPLDQALDLGGFRITDGSHTFPIPAETWIAGKAALVFSNAATDIFHYPRFLSIVDALGTVIDSAYFKETLALEESFLRVFQGHEQFIKTNAPTPGVYVESIASVPILRKTEVAQSIPVFPPSVPHTAASPVAPVAGKDRIETNTTSQDSVSAEENMFAAIRTGSPLGYFISAFILSLVAAGTFLFFRSRHTQL